jgi:hypothetical protein
MVGPLVTGASHAVFIKNEKSGGTEDGLWAENPWGDDDINPWDLLQPTCPVKCMQNSIDNNNSVAVAKGKK